MARTTHRFGCTAIERDAEDTVILHMGSRGHTEHTEVRAGVDAMLGKGVFTRIRPHAQWERDHDGKPQRQPEMIYAFRVPNELFDRILDRRSRTATTKIAA